MCAAGPACDAEGEAERVDDAADDECDVAVPVTEPVDALAMVSPRARVAPSAPAPMAVPMSGRVILTDVLLSSPGTGEPARGGTSCAR